MRRLAFVLLCLIPVAACHGTSGSSGGSGGSSGSPPDYDAGPPYPNVDAGPPADGGPILVPGFGAFTGAYTVNGGGLLLAAQIDGHLAILLNGEPNAYLGYADAGPVDGGHRGTIDAGREEIFNTEIVYPDLETCGPVTLSGLYLEGAHDYTAANDYCANGITVTASFPGARLLGDDFFRQDFAKSGVFDVTETPSASNACTFPGAGPFTATIGFSVDIDGGPAMAMIVGDGLLDEIEVPKPPSGGVLSASSLDSQGNVVGSISLEQSTGAHWTGTRKFNYLLMIPDGGQVLGDDGGVAGPCQAEMNLTGTRRTE